MSFCHQFFTFFSIGISTVLILGHVFFIKVWTSRSVLTLILLLAKTPRNIISIWVNPSVKTYKYVFSEKSGTGHLLSSSLNRSQASYSDSFSPCLKFEISCFFFQYLDIGKNLSENFSSSSSQVWMVPLCKVNNQSLALLVKVKVNNLSFSWSSVMLAGGTQNSHVS